MDTKNVHEQVILFIVQHEGWQDRVYHPSGSGTISLDLARELWPYAEIVGPDDTRWVGRFTMEVMV